MNTQERTKIWMEACPLDVQEEIRRTVQEQIREGVAKLARTRADQPFLGKSYAADVGEFMIAMDQLPAPLSDFQNTPVATLNLATQLMFGGGEGAKKGEIYEMLHAWDSFTMSHSLEHLTEFVDGAIDSIYVILWTLNKLGVPADLCWKLVQDSNMAKLGPDGKPIKNPETGKIMKPEGWKPPDLFGLLAAAAANVTYVGGLARHD